MSLIIFGVLASLLLLYLRADPSTHVGAFYGNALADWFGTFVLVVATKYFFEIGSAESRRPRRRLHQRVARFVIAHSLTLVLLATGAVWIVVYTHSDVNGKAGQVIGNVVSEWTQILGLVLITKYARETGSKEGH